MRKKRKKAVAVLVDGVVHAIGPFPPTAVIVEPSLRRTTRAQRKAAKARERVEPRVSLLCDSRPHMIQPYRGSFWRRAPRTHAQVNCMACLVAQART